MIGSALVTRFTLPIKGLRNNKSMKIRVVTDSTCDLPVDILADLGISVIPNYINIGSESYRDGIDMSRTDFYTRLASRDQHPTTSAPGIGLFEEAYRKLQQEGAEHIISMHIHNKLSSLANVARVASASVSSVKVHVVEVGQLSLGLGFIVMKATQAALEGQSLAEILEIIRSMEERTYIFAVLDTVEYLRNSGRVPRLVSMIADLLRIKPIIQLHQGEIRSAAQVRTSAQGIDWLAERLEKIESIEQLAVLHTNAEEKASSLIRLIHENLDQNLEMVVASVTPVLGVHVGPGGVGLACVKTQV